MGLGSGHLGPGLVCCEHPFDAGAAVVALLLPCRDFGSGLVVVCHSAIEALAAQDADFDLDHVEPTGVLGGVVEFQTAKHAPGFRRGQSAVKGRRAVGRELVEHDADLLGLGEMDIAKLAHAFSEVRCRTARGDLDLAPGPMGVEEDEKLGGTLALILEVKAFAPPWLGRDRRTDFADQQCRGNHEASRSSSSRKTSPSYDEANSNRQNLCEETLEALGLFGSLDDLQHPIAARVERALQFRSGIGAIGETGEIRSERRRPATGGLSVGWPSSSNA